MIEQLRPIGLLVGRIVLGVVFIAHGVQKFGNGLGATADGFAKMGVPLAGVAGPGVALLEVIGGVALIAGALLPLFGTLLAINMIGAMVLVHLPNGFYSANGGYEYVLALAAFSLAIGFSGGGTLAADSKLLRRFGQANSAESRERAAA